jgi:hypothetical protein
MAPCRVSVVCGEELDWWQLRAAIGPDWHFPMSDMLDIGLCNPVVIAAIQVFRR